MSHVPAPNRYDHPNLYRRCGRSGLKLPALSLGLWHNFGRVDDYVDIFYSHRPDPHTPLEETMGAVAHAVKSGKALYAGLSNYNAEQTTRAAKLLRELGTPCLIHQPKYHMFERWIEKDLARVLVDEGIGGI